MSIKNQCEYCMHYDYNEEYECYECDTNLDEDELLRFLSDAQAQCPYFQCGDEYKVIRKQM